MTQTGPLPGPLPKGEGEDSSVCDSADYKHRLKSMPLNASFAFSSCQQSQPAPHNVMQTNQAHAQSLAIDYRQHVDLRRSIFHQA